MTNSTNDRHHLASKNSIDEPVTEGTRFGEAVARRLFLQRTALVDSGSRAGELRDRLG